MRAGGVHGALSRTRLPLFAGVLGWSTPLQSGHKSTIDSGPTTYRLPNGLEVVLEESHLAPVVAIQAWVRVGAGDEPVEKAGIAHIVEHMLFKGTRRRKVGAVARAIESAGGDINAWTSHDETAIHLVLPSDRLALGIDVLADVLQQSVFDPKEFESERKVVLEEVNQGQDEPDRLAGVGLFASAFQRHPYGRPVIGQPETVASISRSDAAGFFSRHYGARNTTLVVTGDFTSSKAQRLIAAAFEEMSPGRELPPRAAEPPTKKPRVTVVARDVKETQILLAWACPPVNHADLPALDLLAVALGQGESSRLHLDLVRQRALVNATSAYLFTGRDPGLVIVSASLIAGADHAAIAALEGLLSQVESLRTTELSDAEIARSRALLESQRVFDRESAQGLARKLGFFASTIGDVRFEDRYLERLAAVSAADVRRVAQAHLRLEGLTLYAQVGKPAKASARAGKGRGVAEARSDAPLARAFAKVIRDLQNKAPRSPVVARAGRATKVKPGTADVIPVRLASGIRVLMLRDPQLPIVALRGTWVGGLRHEDRKSNGASSLIASLLSRGTTAHDAESIMRQVEGRAGTLSGHAGRNSLGLEAEFVTRHFEAGLGLFAECLTDSTFPDRELEHERRLSLEALRQQEDDVSHVAFRAFERTLFGDHPYGLDLIGNATSLPRLGRAQLRRMYRARYPYSLLTIAAVGDIDVDRLPQQLETLFPRVAPVQQVRPPSLPRPRGTRRAIFWPMPREQAHLVLGFPGVTLADPDRYPLEILAQLLSGQGGRLFTEVREKRGLVYSIGAFSLEGLDPGYFAVHAATSPESVPAVVAQIRHELGRIIDEGVPALADLRRVQRHLIGAHAIGLQRRSALAATLAFREAYGLGWHSYREYADRLRDVKVADLARVAQKYWDPRREVLSVVGPRQSLSSWANEVAPGALQEFHQP